MRPTLVLDTNVLVAGLRSSLGASFALLAAVGGGAFDLGVTVALVLEYEAVLKRPGLVPLSPGDVDALLDYFCAAGRRAAVRFTLRPAASDPGDDMVLEAAVASGAEWLVTLNPRDFVDGARRYGVELLSPGDAARRLGLLS